MLRYFPSHKLFVWLGAYDTRHIATGAGLVWHEEGRAFVTRDPYRALRLIEHADERTRVHLAPILANIETSQAHRLADRTGYPAALMDFQAAGIEHAAFQLGKGRRAVAIMDDQGLGKTIQAIGVANKIGAKRLLVVCPAGLRLNWAREITKWHQHNQGVIPLLDGRAEPDKTKTNIVSYDLAAKAARLRPDLIIVDEAHYLKNYAAARTKAVLGDYREQTVGLVAEAPTIFLSGTPMPNGRPDELYPILRRCAPDVIDSMSYGAFLSRFCIFYEKGNDIVVKGARNEDELYNRLRGSGFMVRRLKADVLTELPPKRYKLVVFPVNGETQRIIEKERAFDAREIVEHGAPVGNPVLPELRREMGLAKAWDAADYIRDLLVGGVEKVVVFAHHVEVVAQLESKLKPYGVVFVTGAASAANRQHAVDSFQTDSACRVFIGNSAAYEGITLTAACDVVDVEPEWVPGWNEQKYDRLHRIGQTRGVIVHQLVVEGSLDAVILSAEADKRTGIKEVLDR